MKIFTAAQAHELDKYTMEHEPISSVDLMERAAKALTYAIEEEWGNRTPVVVFAGPGNNGGDALAVARLLAEDGYAVKVYLFNIHNHLSKGCTVNKQRLVDGKRLDGFTEVTRDFDPPVLDRSTLVVDGLFGTGLNKPLSGGFAAMVKYVNQSGAQVVSIDMPSGLMCEDNTYNVRANIIRADLTLTIQQKKLAMLLADNQPYLGRVKVLDIRLSPDYIAKTDAEYVVQEEDDVRAMLRPRGDFDHKGTMGHALLVAGSYGMAGAALLASKACLRAGVGKLTVHTPRGNNAIMQVGVPEAVLHLDHDDVAFTESEEAEPYDAVGIGPGIGQQESTAIALISQIKRSACPVVVDADALNIIAHHRAWIPGLPKDIVLTPHPLEFDRLVGNASSGCYDRLHKAQQMAERLQSYVILKGHYSALCLPDGHVVFNPTGNSGMATAGSGDVLTGIITGLLARGYAQQEACCLGMYLHGLAGDIAAKELGKESLVAGDLVRALPKAFLKLED